MSDKLKALAQEACHALQFSLRYLEDALDSAKAKGAPEMVWKPLEEDVVDHKELIADLEKALADNPPSTDEKQPDALSLADAIDPLKREKLDNSTGTLVASKLRVPTEEEAHQVGAVGAQATDEERLLFEAWMRGHCWALSAKWDGSGYRSEAEVNGDVDPWAMGTRRLWAAWRDRAALAKMDTL